MRWPSACTCVNGHRSIPFSRRLSPLPCRTTSEPRRTSRSVSLSVGASLIRRPVHRGPRQCAHPQRAWTGPARPHDRDDLLDSRRGRWIAHPLARRGSAGKITRRGRGRAAEHPTRSTPTEADMPTPQVEVTVVSGCSSSLQKASRYCRAESGAKQHCGAPARVAVSPASRFAWRGAFRHRRPSTATPGRRPSRLPRRGLVPGGRAGHQSADQAPRRGSL